MQPFYDEPKTGAEMLARYAAIRKRLHTPAKPKPVVAARVWDHNAHVIAWRDSRPSVRNIVLQVCRQHGVTPQELRGNSRVKRIAKARSEAVVRAYVELPNLSITAIAKHLGYSDHSVVIHHVRKAGVSMRVTK